MKKSLLNMILLVCIMLSGSFVGATALPPELDYASLPRQSFEFADLGVRFSIVPYGVYYGDKIQDDDQLSYGVAYASGNSIFYCSGLSNKKAVYDTSIAQCKSEGGEQMATVYTIAKGKSVRSFLQSFISDKKMCRVMSSFIDHTEILNGFSRLPQKGHIYYGFTPTALARETYKNDIDGGYEQSCPYPYGYRYYILYNPKYRRLAMLYLGQQSYDYPGFFETFSLYK